MWQVAREKRNVVEPKKEIVDREVRAADAKVLRSVYRQRLHRPACPGYRLAGPAVRYLTLIAWLTAAAGGGGQ